jgi:lipopolysaccharide export system permease protein
VWNYRYHRYLFTSLLGPVIFITLSLTAIIWLAQSLRFVDLIVNRGLTVSLFLYLTMLLMPSLLSLVLPVALFSAILYGYHKLGSDSELLVLQNAGLSKLQLAAPALTLAAIVTVMSYSIMLYLLPVSYREFKDLQFFIRNNYASLLLQEGVFTSPTDKLTVYIRKHESNGALRGILVHDSTDPDQPKTMMARQGYMVNSPNGPQIVLENGNRQEVNRQTKQLSLLYFDRYVLNLSLFNKSEGLRSRDPQERFVNELFTPLAGDDVSPAERGKALAEAHQRLTWPLYNMALAALALACLLSGDFNRRGQWRRVLLAAFLGLIGVAFALGLSNLVSHQTIFAVLMYASPLMFLGGACWVLYRPSHGGKAL